MGNIKAALKFKCPRCEQGNLYKAKNPYKRGTMFVMETNCITCGLKYEKEGGFFYGAMYVSYMLNVGLFVTATVLWYVLFENKMDWRIYIGLYVVLTLFLVPILYRLSRSLWLMIMIKYEPQKTGAR
ncbi:MAG: hypothetical protein ACI9DJ_000638 [Algoriphagus sp.]|jgi:uncharacterized protein (DUF983 family)